MEVLGDLEHLLRPAAAMRHALLVRRPERLVQFLLDGGVLHPVVEPLEIRGVAVELPQRVEAQKARMLLLPFLERRANGEWRAVAREEVGRTRYPLIDEERLAAPRVFRIDGACGIGEHLLEAVRRKAAFLVRKAAHVFLRILVRLGQRRKALDLHAAVDGIRGYRFAEHRKLREHGRRNISFAIRYEHRDERFGCKNRFSRTRHQNEHADKDNQLVQTHFLRNHYLSSCTSMRPIL